MAANFVPVVPTIEICFTLLNQSFSPCQDGESGEANTTTTNKQRQTNKTKASPEAAQLEHAEAHNADLLVALRPRPMHKSSSVFTRSGPVRCTGQASQIASPADEHVDRGAGHDLGLNGVF